MIDNDLMEKVSDITGTDYSDIDDSVETAESIIEDLLHEIEHLNETVEHIIHDRDDNYKRIPYEEMI